MKFIIVWILSIFRKPEAEIVLDTRSVAAWPFPAEQERPKRVKKTRALPSRATKTKQAVAAKKTVVAKKAVKK
jgi:hypothetical protein